MELAPNREPRFIVIGCDYTCESQPDRCMADQNETTPSDDGCELYLHIQNCMELHANMICDFRDLSCSESKLHHSDQGFTDTDCYRCDAMQPRWGKIYTKSTSRTRN